MSASPDYAQLVSLLEERLTTIADIDWRDRDPEGQLAALGDVSGKIDVWAKAHINTVSPQMAHFLEGASYAKALAVAKTLARTTEPSSGSQD